MKEDVEVECNQAALEGQERSPTSIRETYTALLYTLWKKKWSSFISSCLACLAWLVAVTGDKKRSSTEDLCEIFMFAPRRRRWWLLETTRQPLEAEEFHRKVSFLNRMKNEINE